MKTLRKLRCVLMLVVVVAMIGCGGTESPPPEKNTNVSSRSNTNNSNKTAAGQSVSSTPRENGNDAVGEEGTKAHPEKSLEASKQAGNANKQPAREITSPKPGAATNPSPANGETANSAAQSEKPRVEPTPDTDSGSKEPPQSSIMDWIIPGLLVAAGFLVVAFVALGLLHLRNRSKLHLESNVARAAAAGVSATREAQNEILDKLAALSSSQSETTTRLHDVHSEVRSLARLMRDSSSDRGDHRGYASLTAPYSQTVPSSKEEPEFPVSAVDYLGKMTRYANVVRPDFQNGLLVSAPDGKGELMLISDSRMPDDTQPLFVVPRATQFQTKQDFYTYYEKYYDCVRPSAGDVWIIDPAVVEKVSGGWQLREKGVLEIR